MPTANKYWPEVRSTRQGSIGHTHALARKGIAKVFELLGGEQGLWAWAMADDKNKFAFYTILLPKLIPAEISDALKSGDNRIQVVILPAGQASSQVAGNGSSDEPSGVASIPSVSKPNDLPEQDKAGGMLSKGQGHDEDSEA